ncbi:hypothetical protein Nepgr_016268 [Nepenthes gracilis]|uniref:Uncharacterized protein n=1 Tax=Nepenthes gracilis TaxID=150966 RepID=A0AAD3XR59_NEPGR|nr:hypothetical protein Nepgr_016268 [Nepenthes gracilis]
MRISINPNVKISMVNTPNDPKQRKPDFTCHCCLLAAILIVANYGKNASIFITVVEFETLGLIEEGIVCAEMKKGLHPQMQWISYVTQSGRLMHITMTKIHRVGKVYHFRARRQMAQSLGQIAKFNRRYGEKTEANEEK